MLADDRCGVIGLERSPAGDQLVQHRAEAVEVGLRRDLAAQGLLGWHVGYGADHHPVLRQPATVEAHREPEVTDLGRTFRGEPDVSRLHVAVHDAAGVGELQATRDVLRDGERALQRERSLCSFQLALDITAFEQLGHDEGSATLLADLEDGDDVGVRTEAPHRLRSRTMRSRPAASSPSVLISAKATSRSRVVSWARKTRFFPPSPRKRVTV